MIFHKKLFYFIINFLMSRNQIDLKHKNQLNNTANMVDLGIDLKEFYPSVEWDILSVPAERHEK
jgi:nicotinic acetylcholine receptor, invertebrate